MLREHICFLFLLLAGFCMQFIRSEDLLSRSSDILSRKKRYVAFPEGSSFSIAGCMTVGVIGQPAPATSPGTFSFGLNWAIAYELPNVTETAAYYHVKKHKKAHQRRSRRDFYDKLETILNDMGYNGRQCILKTICETAQRIVPRGPNMIEEIFRTLFAMPLTKLVSSESLQHSIYASAQRLGAFVDNCDSMFSCPISLVDWAKGYYNARSPTIDTSRSPWSLFGSNFV